MQKKASKAETDRRHEHRTRVAFHAWVSERDSLDCVHCLVRDANADGCRIVSSAVNEIPDEICLTFPHAKEPFDGEVVWRNGKEAGIKFVGVHHSKPAE